MATREGPAKRSGEQPAVIRTYPAPPAASLPIGRQKRPETASTDLPCPGVGCHVWPCDPDLGTGQ